jgi:hypothetical protein
MVPGNAKCLKKVFDKVVEPLVLLSLVFKYQIVGFALLEQRYRYGVLSL